MIQSTATSFRLEAAFGWEARELPQTPFILVGMTGHPGLTLGGNQENPTTMEEMKGVLN